MRNQRTGLASPLTQSAKRLPAALCRAGAVIALLFCLGEASGTKAQERQLGIDFTTVIPRGEFNRNVRNNGYGVGGQFLVGLGRSPFLVGVDAGYALYGSDEHKEPISETIPEVRVKVRTNNNIVFTHFLARAQPRTGNVRPYIDGLIGFKYLFTDTSILNDFNDEELASTKNLSDLTLSYGVGGGVQIRLARIGRNGDVALDGKVRYLRGQRAEYLKEGSIRRENGSVFFDVLTSRTDVVTVQVGVTFRF
jgi:opacity protein-like surface antigen